MCTDAATRHSYAPTCIAKRQPQLFSRDSYSQRRTEVATRNRTVPKRTASADTGEADELDQVCRYDTTGVCMWLTWPAQRVKRSLRDNLAGQGRAMLLEHTTKWSPALGRRTPIGRRCPAAAPGRPHATSCAHDNTFCAQVPACCRGLSQMVAIGFTGGRQKPAYQDRNGCPLFPVMHKSENSPE